jgi:hypothetical protein
MPVADQSDVRRVALSLPGTSEAEDRFAFSVENKGKQKGFAWAWAERVEPKKPRVYRPDVLAVRVADQHEKQALLAADDAKFFTEPHYNGFPAVLVRLPAIGADELAELIVDAWRGPGVPQRGALVHCERVDEEVTHDPDVSRRGAAHRRPA